MTSNIVANLDDRVITSRCWVYESFQFNTQQVQVWLIAAVMTSEHMYTVLKETKDYFSFFFRGLQSSENSNHICIYNSFSAAAHQLVDFSRHLNLLLHQIRETAGSLNKIVMEFYERRSSGSVVFAFKTF